MDPIAGETWREIGTDNEVVIVNVVVHDKVQHSHRNYVSVHAVGQQKYVRYILLDQFPRQFERVIGEKK